MFFNALRRFLSGRPPAQNADTFLQLNETELHFQLDQAATPYECLCVMRRLRDSYAETVRMRQNCGLADADGSKVLRDIEKRIRETTVRRVNLLIRRILQTYDLDSCFDEFAAMLQEARTPEAVLAMYRTYSQQLCCHLYGLDVHQKAISFRRQIVILSGGGNGDTDPFYELDYPEQINEILGQLEAIYRSRCAEIKTT